MCAAACFLADRNEPIFATVGDTVASYIGRADETTAGWCLIDYQNIEAWRKGKNGELGGDTYERDPKVRLHCATSKTRWRTTIGLCTFYVTLACVLLAFGADEAEDVYSLNAMWNLGMVP